MKYRYRTLGFLFALAMITYLDRVAISVTGTAIQHDLGLRPDQWGWVLGAFTISYGLFEVPTGAMCDRIGPRRVITRIVAWWSVFTMATGAVTGYGQLLAARFLFGMGEAGAFPCGGACIARWFPRAERARALGVFWMATRVGGAVTPLLVVPIQQLHGWRMCFYVFGAVGLVWAVLWYAWFRDTPAEKAGISAQEVAEIGTTGELDAHLNIPWKRILTQANLWWIVFMYVTYCWTSFFYLSWLHVFLQKGRGYSASDLLAFSWLPFVCGACGNLLGGFSSDFLVRKLGLKWGRRLVGVGGLLISATFVAATYTTDDKLLTVIFLAIGYAGSDFMLPVAWAVCVDIGGKYVGAVTGVMNMSGQFGSFLTVVAFGYIVEATGSYNAPLVPMAIMSLISALAWLKIDPTRSLLGEARA